MSKGYIHIYTGNGKGKTTAAFGLAVRALLSGKKIYVGQFVKDMKYNETKLTDHFNDIVIEQLGCGCFINRPPSPQDIESAISGLRRSSKALSSDAYDVVILDELTIALYYKLFDVHEVIDMIKSKAEKTEVIITGRYAPQELIDIADLVTDMTEIKHYYTQGVLSRDGIDK